MLENSELGSRGILLCSENKAYAKSRFSHDTVTAQMISAFVFVTLLLPKSEISSL